MGGGVAGRGFSGWMVGVAALCAAAGALPTARGQCEPEWVQRFDVPAARIEPGIAYDADREVVVMAGGGGDSPAFRQVWEWDGARWSRRSDIVGGPLQFGWSPMVYDSYRKVMVARVYRGLLPPETWELHGNTWWLRATGGPEGSYMSMAFDTWRGVTVLWGRQDVGTWEWDGSRWAFRDPGPAGEYPNYEVAFDENRGVTVAFGLDDSLEAKTWEWDGRSWELVATGGPAPRVEHAMAYDPVRRSVLVYGGGLSGPRYDDMWAWDGGSWTFVSAGQPGIREQAGMAYDAARGQMIVFGGESGDVQWRPLLGDTWALDGNMWMQVDEGDPPVEWSPVMAYDSVRQRAVLLGTIGGAAQLWEHDGERWRSVLVAMPPARRGHSMVFHEDLGATVLFGGYVDNDPVADMWTWDGEEWVEIASPGPSPRGYAAMVYDSDRKSIVLFGGSGGGQGVGDTWEYRGGKWVLRATTGPPPRYFASAAYDRIRREVLLFGGFDPQTQATLDDTWSWDGESWRQRQVTGPRRRIDGACAFSDALGACVLFGGRDTPRLFRDTWAWDETSWMEWRFGYSDQPDSRAGHQMVEAGRGGPLMMYGGRRGGIHYYAETWNLAVGVADDMGDVNCDCAVNAFDIEPFLLALVDPGGYGKAYPGCDIGLADANGDGRVDAFDIEAFVGLLVP